MSVLLAKAKGLVPSIVKTIELAIIYQQARDRFELENPTEDGRLPTMENHLKFKSDPNISATRKDIVNYMMSLSYDNLMIIQSIMYIGRDERDPRELEFQIGSENYDEIYEEARRNGVLDSPQKKLFDHLKTVKGSKETKEIAINMMLEKSPLPDYLERGMNILELTK